jgi:hypothetical protein
MLPAFDFHCALLIVAGSVVSLVGLLAGFPYGKAITGNAPEAVVRAWGFSHSSPGRGGNNPIAIGAALPWLAAGGWERPLVAWGFALSGLAFCIALPFGAWKGQRGLAATGPLDNWVVYWGNVTGALASLVGTVALVYAAIRSMPGSAA